MEGPRWVGDEEEYGLSARTLVVTLRCGFRLACVAVVCCASPHVALGLEVSSPDALGIIGGPKSRSGGGPEPAPPRAAGARGKFFGFVYIIIYMDMYMWYTMP